MACIASLTEVHACHHVCLVDSDVRLDGKHAASLAHHKDSSGLLLTRGDKACNQQLLPGSTHMHQHIRQSGHAEAGRWLPVAGGCLNIAIVVWSHAKALSATGTLKANSKPSAVAGTAVACTGIFGTEERGGKAAPVDALALPLAAELNLGMATCPLPAGCILRLTLIASGWAASAWGADKHEASGCAACTCACLLVGGGSLPLSICFSEDMESQICCKLLLEAESQCIDWGLVIAAVSNGMAGGACPTGCCCAFWLFRNARISEQDDADLLMDSVSLSQAACASLLGESLCDWSRCGSFWLCLESCSNRSSNA